MEIRFLPLYFLKGLNKETPKVKYTSADPGEVKSDEQVKVPSKISFTLKPFNRCV